MLNIEFFALHWRLSGKLKCWRSRLGKCNSAAVALLGVRERLRRPRISPLISAIGVLVLLAAAQSHQGHQLFLKAATAQQKPCVHEADNPHETS